MNKTESTIVGNFWQRKMIHAYSRMNAMGILNHPISQQVFRKFYFYYKSQIEDPFLRLTKEHPELFKNGHILDAGANIGYTASVFARVVSPGFRVYAFEPELRNFQQLQAVCRERRLQDRVLPVQAAIGDREAQMTLWINPADQSDHRLMTDRFKGEEGQAAESASVPMMSLDHFVDSLTEAKAVAFVKLDIQGFEGPALEGMKKILQDNPQVAVAVEYCRSKMEILGMDPQQITTFFRTHGYHLYSLSLADGLSETAYDALDQLSEKRGYIDLLFSKGRL